MSSSSPLEAIRLRARWQKRPAPAQRSCIVLALVALVVTAILLMVPRIAVAQAVRGEATFDASAGYGRLLLRFSQPVDAQVRQAGGILIVTFAQPVDVAIHRVNVGNADWISAARRDPDGRALRFAVARKVKVHTIVAAERMFVDLLPEPWTEELPGLPPEVVEDLAKRTRAAEGVIREQKQLTAKPKPAPIRVRVANHPTFTRYIFPLPDLTGVGTQRTRDKLALSFAKPLEFDLTEAKLATVPAVESVEASTAAETAAVRFAFSEEVDLRTFREDFSYVVDVTPIDRPRSDAKPGVLDASRADAPGSSPLPGIEAPETVPARQEAAKAAPAPAPAAMLPVKPPAAVAPVASDLPAAPPAGKPADAPSALAADDAVPPAIPALSSPAIPAPAPPAAPRRTAPPAAALPIDSTKPVAAEIRRQGDNLSVQFPFAAPTPAAVFQRADTLWLVFDTPAKLDIAVLGNEPSRTIRSAAVTRAGDAQIVRLKLERPRIASLAAEGAAWVVTLGDGMNEPTTPLGISRNIVGPARTSVTVPFDDPRQLHWLTDPEIGDTLLVITGLGPARGFLKTQSFVEFRALASTHGIAIQRFADDLSAELSADKILIARPGGLTLSDRAEGTRGTALARAVTFDVQLWGFDREANFNERQFQLVGAAADAPPNRRNAYRLELARFYLSREMFSEAKAVLDVAIADEKPTANDPSALVLRAVANLMLDRPDVALKDLGNPVVGNQHDAQLWRALAYVRQGRWAEARTSFRDVETAMSTLPLELQRLALKDSLHASIEVGDFATASIRLNDFETIGVPRELEPAVSLLTGRLAEGFGRKNEALASYHFASMSSDRPAAAAGRLREIALRYALGDLKKSDAINDLEMLTTGWRGDDVEAEALQILARLYTEDERYRDAFDAMRTALVYHPQSEMTRRLQDGASLAFDSLFLGGKSEALPAIDALSLFYDFRELTPIGRRGDEMIRRLSDRLVTVDLLDQAAELLQHQIDKRLQGAARAQVATRLAVIYLLNHKPDRAQAALRTTRSANLSNEVRNQRLLIESRALSDLGRHDLAIEVIASIQGREAVRLRSDIHWAARRWQASAEQMELLYGDRWRDFQPLAEGERSDILRAAVGFALADDIIGVARLREKYAAKMSEGAAQRSFELVTSGLGPDSTEFREVARTIAATDTLDGFLRDMRARYPEMNAFTHAPAVQQPASTQSGKAERESTSALASKS